MQTSSDDAGADVVKRRALVDPERLANLDHGDAVASCTRHELEEGIDEGRDRCWLCTPVSACTPLLRASSETHSVVAAGDRDPGSFRRNSDAELLSVLVLEHVKAEHGLAVVERLERMRRRRRCRLFRLALALGGDSVLGRLLLARARARARASARVGRVRNVDLGFGCDNGDGHNDGEGDVILLDERVPDERKECLVRVLRLRGGERRESRLRVVVAVDKGPESTDVRSCETGTGTGRCEASAGRVRSS